MRAASKRVSRLLLPGMAALLLMQGVPGAAQTWNWNKAPYRLSTQGTYVRFEPNIIADRFGRTHVMWSQNSVQVCCLNGSYSTMQYARFDGVSWTGPVEIQRVVNSTVELASIYIDSTDTLHAAWVQGPLGAVATSIYYSAVALENVLDPSRWQTPRRLDITGPGTDGLRLKVDRNGTLHLLMKKRNTGVLYTRSTDGATKWSTPLQLDTEKPQGYLPGVIQMALDEQGTLHAAWNHLDSNSSNQGKQLQYLRSTDGGVTWSPAFTVDQYGSFEADGNPTGNFGAPYGLVTSGNTVHLVWIGGTAAGVGRRHRISTDGGVTWGTTAKDVFGLWGNQNGDGLAADASGRLYWIGLSRKQLSGSLWEGLWGSSWNNGAWADAKPVITVLPPGADSSRVAATADGNLVAIFRNQPSPDTLWATHTVSPYLYFPHYADGGGWSMRLAISNLSSRRAVGTLAIFDQSGRPQELPFDGGATNRIDLDLAPLSTAVFQSTGTSDPMRTGYIRVDLDQPEISGVAIFQNVNRTEASVLPAQHGRRFALLVERTPVMQTGVAFARHTITQPIRLTLLDLAGNVVDTKDYTGSVQAARFADELFPDKVPEGFRGTLLIESDALFSAMGLRFGAGVLSTLAVTDLDSIPGTGTYYFPHYGDGDGLSMILGVNNLSSNRSTGKLTLLDASGKPQSLPFESGPSNELTLGLEKNAATIAKSQGTSSPLKSGYVKVEMNQREASGVAIFKYTDGREASILPSYTGKKFSLFVERSASFDTGIAVARTTTKAVTLKLYDDKGTLVSTAKDYVFDKGDYQRARFLGEVYSLPENFRGLLIMESEADFTTVGLRYGGSVLSTIPVTPIN
jgi:hypothetical protein